MVGARTKDRAVFTPGAALVTDSGALFSTAGYELEFAHGQWALFPPNAEQGLKLDSYYSSPQAFHAEKLREAQAKCEFWTREAARFEEFMKN